MKKIETFCDDCGKEITHNVKTLRYDNFGEFLESLTDKDICLSCIKTRLNATFKKYPLGSLKCKLCNSTGRIKIRGINNDYEMRPEYTYVDCQQCNGKHVIRLEL